MHPLVGTRYKKRGDNYDLCENDFNKLSASEKDQFLRIDHPQQPWRPQRNPQPCSVKPQARFVEHVNLPDGTEILPGTEFTKIWRLKNTGDKAWPENTRLVFTGGDKFVGDWVDAKKEGEGELIYHNGDRFNGQWSDDRASGYGVFKYANGNRYEGQWLDDKRHGRGTFACMEDGSDSVYDGEFAFGRKEGRGVLKFQNGHILSGIWKQGELTAVTEFVFGNDSPWRNPDL